MSTNEKAVSTNVVVKETEASVIPNPHAEAAQLRVLDLDRMKEQIPRFIIPASAKDTARLNSAASVPAAFVALSAMAVANHNVLVRGGAATPDEVRDLLAYADAYEPYVDEVEAFAQFMRHSVMAARNQAGAEALTTYALAQRLAKRPEHAGLAAVVADMRRALGRGRKTSKPTQTEPVPAPPVDKK